MENTVEELRHRIGDRSSMLAWDMSHVDALIVAVEERTKKRILDASVAKFNMGGGVYVIIRTSVLEEVK